MNQPTTILKGIAVRTNKKLEEARLMLAPEYSYNRRPDLTGTIRGAVPGHGGDVYWVAHEHGTAAYSSDEFELELESNAADGGR